MKLERLAILILLPLLVSGCWGWHKQKPDPKVTSVASPTTNSKLIVTPETALIGKVASVNANAKFAVLNFPIGHLPSLEQRLNVYRNGLKVGEVKITGPQRDDNTVADIVAGESKVGDEVREN